MLPAQNKLNSSVQFRTTMRNGRRAGSKTLVVHLWDSAESLDGSGGSTEIASTGGPRFGLIVSKAVGNAVVRHRTSRRLRHVCSKIAAELSPTDFVVVRALAPSAEASSRDLEKDLVLAVNKARRVRGK
ncbi:ribonuclease P protein component [Corynebacterium pacaense]|uniref:ribonuclease P protein component n=1 Tax=Corynebacterium pacaense TaxID=1816684 RepID=UPI0009BAD423|nr:ribonuclease P protein component [Corynebacterium pacaense]